MSDNAGYSHESATDIRFCYQLQQGPNKVDGPVQRLIFLGILLDTVAMSMELPEKKLTELKELLQKANMSEKLTKQQLQSLTGKLNWASQCIQGGRTFM